MTRTRNQLEKLREREEKIRDLGQEKEAEGFGKVSVYPDDGECHPGKIAEGVTDKGTGRVEVVVEEAEDDADEGKDEGEG
jgi:precorrin-6B methylase 1|eukprot:evm.model.NODE_30747_length_47682_cov_25.534710.17